MYAHKHNRGSCGGWEDWLICIWVQGLSAPMLLGIDWNGPFVPHIESREPRNITTVPDGHQA